MSSWRGKSSDSPGQAQAQPGRLTGSLVRRRSRKVYVTSAGNDDIGEVLRSMGVAFEPFAGAYDCDLLFANCGSPDHLDEASIQQFVRAGGCLYASDLTNDLLDSAFPGMFDFDASGSVGMVDAEVVDAELRGVVGDLITIDFDMASWAVLDSCQGETLVEAAPGSEYAGCPLMVKVGVGKGTVFYTSFHNSAQASEQEKVLLELLVLKQISASSKTTLAQASQSLGISLEDLQKRAND